MPTVSILADNGALSGSAGLKTSGGNDGVLLLQTTTAGGTPTTAISISNTQIVTYTNQPTYTGGTANGVAYLNGSKVLTTGSALVFDGTNLGVGVTPSTWYSGYTAIEINNSGAAIFGRTSTIETGIATNLYRNAAGTWIYKATGRGALFDCDGAWTWYQSSSGSAGASATLTASMTLDTSGNLGLGTSSPSDTIGYGRTLDIQGSIGAVIYLRDSDNPTTQYGFLSFDGNAGVNNLNISNASSTGPIRLFTNNTERARIDSSGRFIVGGTTAYGAAATFTAAGGSVVVNQTGSTSYAGYRIYNDIASANRALEIDYSGSAYSGSLISGGPSGESAVITTTGAYPLTLGTNNTARLTIASDGSMTMSGTIRPAAILSPNTSTVVAPDSAMPSTANSFLYTLAGGPGSNDGHTFGMTWTSASVYGAQLWFDTDPTYLMAMRQRDSVGTWNAWSYLLNTNTYKVYTTQGGGSTSSSGTRASVTFTLNSASNKILVFGSDLLRCSSGWLRGIAYIDSTTIEGEFMYQQANGNLWQTTTGIATVNNAAAGSHTISLYADFASGGGAWDGPTYLQVIVWDGI